MAKFLIDFPDTTGPHGVALSFASGISENRGMTIHQLVGEALASYLGTTGERTDIDDVIDEMVRRGDVIVLSAEADLSRAQRKFYLIGKSDSNSQKVLPSQHAVNSDLANTILLIVGDKKIGRDALCCLIYFADLIHFLRHGKTVTGLCQIKASRRPTIGCMAEVRQFLVNKEFLREHVVSDGIIRSFSYTLPDGVSLDEIHWAMPAGALKTVDQVRKRLGGFSHGALSTALCEFEPWKTTQYGQDLDFRRAMDDLALASWLKEHGIALASCSD